MRNLKITTVFFVSIPIVLGLNQHFHNHNHHERVKRQGDFSPFNKDFGINLQKQIADQIAGIQQQVDQQLAPIRRMQIRTSMAAGQGGTTVITYGGKTILFVTNSIRSVCPSNVNRPDKKVAECTSNLVPYNGTDPCTLGMSYSRYNQLFCFGLHSSLFCENNVCECVHGTNYTLPQLKDLCGQGFDTPNYVQYEYYPNMYDPNMIDITMIKNMGICQNSDDWHCVWQDTGFPFIYKK